MIKVGVTGGIGTGKTVVCRIFETLGVPIYNADQKARKIMNTDSEVVSEIKKIFGQGVYLSSGELDREYLSKVVFKDQKQLEKLNAIVHPAVKRDFESWVLKQNAPYVIKEAALLVESGSFRELDKLIVVIAPKPLRINRVLSRDPHRDVQQVKSIIRNQFSDNEKKKYGNFIINNDENHPILPVVLQIHLELLQKS